MESHGPRAVLPRITKAYARSLISKERIVVDEDMCIVICMVKLKNEHRLVAEAIVANNLTFNVERGTKIARAKIIEKIIDREMYLLRAKLQEQREAEKQYVE